jgi:hypothetical protein
MQQTIIDFIKAYYQAMYEIDYNYKKINKSIRSQRSMTDEESSELLQRALANKAKIHGQYWGTAVEYSMLDSINWPSEYNLSNANNWQVRETKPGCFELSFILNHAPFGDREFKYQIAVDGKSFRILHRQQQYISSPGTAIDPKPEETSLIPQFIDKGIPWMFPTGLRRFKSTSTELDALEKKLACTMPMGYRDFMLRYGEGVICKYLRIYTPLQILQEYKQFQARVASCYFWSEGAKIASQEQVCQSIPIADTLDGDELIFHPSSPDKLWVLPRYEGRIYQVEKHLANAIHWILSGGVLTNPFWIATFHPYCSKT